MFGYSKYFVLNRETKGGLILESVSLWLKSPKKGAKTYIEHYPSEEMILRIVIWHPFLEILAKLKHFRILSHL